MASMKVRVSSDSNKCIDNLPKLLVLDLYVVRLPTTFTFD